MRLLILFILLLTACEKAAPPLPGKRVNVLHYDFFEENKEAAANIKLPTQMNAMNWDHSDRGQFTGLPGNISLVKNIKKERNISPRKFSPTSAMDSAVIIISNILYSYTNTILSAYDISAGKVLWSVSPLNKREKSDVLGGSITYHNNVIYLSSGSRDFIAVNSENGKELWRIKLPNIVNSIPLVHNNKIYVTSADNKVSCISVEGKLLWKYNAAIYSLASNRFYAPSVAYADQIITVTTAGDLIILNSFDGSVTTEVSLATESIIGDGSLARGPIASLYLDKDNLYLLTGESEFIKLDLAHMAISWRQMIPGSKSFWVAGDASYILTDNDQLIALENSLGKMIWVKDLSQYNEKNKFADFYGPILAGGQLIISASNGKFFLFDPHNGKLILQQDSGVNSSRMPIIVNKTLYFIDKSGKLSIWK